MDLATHLPQLNERALEQWIATANRHLPPWVSGLLILLIAYELAQLTWALLPGAPLNGPAPVVTPPSASGAATSNGPAPDVARVVQAHLFGEAPAEVPEPVVQEVVDAPDTTLSVKLLGIVSLSGGNDEAGIAIIADGRGNQKVYQVGQAIDGGGGALLHTVYGDRVLLNRSGRLETLRLPKELQRSPVAAAPRVAPAPAAASIRDVISENASRITDIIRVAPHIEQGQMVGFRVNPGRDRDQFTALGLMPGDVVTDINGTPMTDPAQGLAVFEALGEATMANVTVIREGEAQVLPIDTSQLESLAEGRQ